MTKNLRTSALLALALVLGMGSSFVPPASAEDLAEMVKPAVQPTLEPVVGRFGPSDLRKTETQREEVRELARRVLGVIMGERTDTDIDAIQRLIEGGHVRTSNVRLQQSLGVILGDALARDLRELSWAVVDDRYGHSRTLRYRDSIHLFFPITMISKRIKAGERIDARGLYDQVVQGVAELDEEREARRRRSQGRR